MNKGDRRRNRRRYRVRYDRIVVMALVVIVIIVLATSCVKALSKNDDEPSESSSSASQSEQENEQEQPTAAPEVQEEQSTTSAAEEEADSFTSEKHERDEVNTGDLLLVNAEHEYKFIDGDVDLLTLYDNKNDYYGSGDYVTKMDKETLYHLNDMIEAFAKASSLSSTDIFVIDGYRTFDEQEERHSSGKSKTFEAGYTDYHTGRTFDMFRMNSDMTPSYFAAEGDCAWFADHASDYGFIVRFPEGKDEITGENARKYTYRYVGAPHASYIYENGLCMEEYISEVRTHTKDKPLEISAGGQSYSVYFVPAEDSGATDVPVPADKAYTVSGDNISGFIVTVTE